MEIPNGRIDIEALRKEYAETQPLVESRCDPRDKFIVESLFLDTYERLGEGEFPKKNGLGSLRLYRGYIAGIKYPGPRQHIAVLLDTDGGSYKLEPEGTELDVDFVLFPERTVRDDWGDGNESSGLVALVRNFAMMDVPGPGPCPIKEQESAFSNSFINLEQNSFDSIEPLLTVYYRNVFAAQIVKHRQQLQEQATTEE